MGNNLTGYGTIGFGNKIETFEFGVAYEFSKNTELNLFYKSTKYKDLEFDGASLKYDLKVDGPGFGVTFKF
jgi:predicted porin